MRSLTILVDMDDVLENFSEEWIKYLNEQHGTDVKHSDITEWEISKFFPTVDRQGLYAPLFEPDFWERVKPLPGAVSTVKRLIDDGHKIFVVTASHFDTLSLKFNSVLYKYFPFLTYKDIIVASKKQLILGDVLIDDAPHNLEGGSYKGILMNAYHNDSYDAEKNGFVRAKNWDTVYQIIKQMAEE